MMAFLNIIPKIKTEVAICLSHHKYEVIKCFSLTSCDISYKLYKWHISWHGMSMRLWNALALHLVIYLISYISGISLLAKHKYEAIKYFSPTSCNISYKLYLCQITYITFMFIGIIFDL